MTLKDDVLYVGTRQAARDCGVAQRTINRWINEGKLHAERAFEDGPWMIEWGALQRFSKPQDCDEPDCADAAYK